MIKSNEMRKPVLDRSRFTGYESTARHIESKFDDRLFYMTFMMEKSRNPQLDLSELFPAYAQSLPLAESVQQHKTQEQMRDICENVILHNTESGYDWTVINFRSGSQLWNDDGFSVVETSIGFRLVGCEQEWKYLNQGEARITIFAFGGRPGEYRESMAFLKVTSPGGKESFFELAELSLLTFVVPQSFSDEDTKRMSAEGVSGDTRSIFTFYHRSSNAFFMDYAALVRDLV